MAIPTSWADEADVLRLTGKTVTAEVVAQATGIVELTSGGRLARLDTALVSPRNFDWLKRAVAYQAAFMDEHPDYFTRMDVSSYSQDGVSATIRPDGLVLAPLARRCLKRLSWRGTRTLVPTRSDVRPSDESGWVYGTELDDDALPWRPA